VEVALLDENRALVRRWVSDADRQESGYHSVLHFMMYYARLLFFMGFDSTADDLVGWMEDAVKMLAEAREGEPVVVARDWVLETESDETPRTVWSSSLTQVGPGKYRCAEKRPNDPQCPDAQGVALLHLQTLVNTLPALERAYLALGIAGMHEYYRDILHWHNSKSLHPATAYGMDYARKVLERRS
ncbi:MAG: hypothetical protein JXA36_04965, partial [Coriobacteriia bacterium]|nr:hypothetical protein [Coriobacteriia bacterium]